MINYLEIRDQTHLMNAEGAADDKPSVAEVEQAIRQRGYLAENISISYDRPQKMWRFTAQLKLRDDLSEDEIQCRQRYKKMKKLLDWYRKIINQRDT